MNNESEWWKVDESEKIHQENTVHNSPILEGKISPLIDENVPIEEVIPKHFSSNDRKMELVASSTIFAIGLLFPWAYWVEISGLSYIIDTLENFSWFIEYNYSDSVSGAYEYNFLEQIGWLLFILSPLLLSINLVVMWYYYLEKKIDITKTSLYIHFSIFIAIFIISFINIGAIPWLTEEYGFGFNLMLFSGLGLNPHTSSKISEIIREYWKEL